MLREKKCSEPRVVCGLYFTISIIRVSPIQKKRDKMNRNLNSNSRTMKSFIVEEDMVIFHILLQDFARCARGFFRGPGRENPRVRSGR